MSSPPPCLTPSASDRPPETVRTALITRWARAWIALRTPTASPLTGTWRGISGWGHEALADQGHGCVFTTKELPIVAVVAVIVSNVVPAAVWPLGILLFALLVLMTPVK
jgi:hypothetical protein